MSDVNGAISMTTETAAACAAIESREPINFDNCLNQNDYVVSLKKIFLTRYNHPPTDASYFKRFKYMLLCPPHTKVAKFILRLIVYGLMIGLIFTIFHDDRSNIFMTCFTYILLFIICTISGQLVSYVKLPPLLGMLIIGCFLRNTPKVKGIFERHLNTQWSSTLRNMALTIILVKAGLGLDPVSLRSLSCAVIRLAFTPCIVECVTAAVASHILLNLPLQWAFMLGFVLAAVSPAVVVPLLLTLQEQQYGVDAGIPTLVIAASSIDDVLAITGFGVVLGITFSRGHLVWSIFKGPIEALVGICIGVAWGALVWFIPSKETVNIGAFRTFMVVAGALFFMFGSQVVRFPGSGTLCALALAFVAAYGWKSSDWSGENNPVLTCVSYLWTVCEPVMFGLIGAEINLATIQPKHVGLGIAVLLICLLFRLVASYLAVFGLGLNTKEKLFIALAWLPKATVQAAIGTVGLDYAQRHRPGDGVMAESGMKLLTLSVLSIVITAPLGSLAITLSGPRLLKAATKMGADSNLCKSIEENSSENELNDGS